VKSDPGKKGTLVEVAVPLPIDGTLTYRVPEGLEGRAAPGCRVRVRVGNRRLTGILLPRTPEAPEGVRVRSLDGILDLRPVLPLELLSLGEFVADYYMAPIGEVLHGFVPAKLEPWGSRRIWLTDAGALTPARSAAEESIIELLRARGRTSLSDLDGALRIPDLDRVVERLRDEGRVVVAEATRSGSRYEAAIELGPGNPDELLERCGRSRPAREVVALLVALGRPATVTQVLESVGCSRGVVRRLVSLRVVREFSQLARLDLDDHMTTVTETAQIELRADQLAATRSIEERLTAGEYSALLLAGITGSGKTEVYLRAVEKALVLERSAIVLVPEIALVPVLAATLRGRFGSRLAILHSALGRSERYQEWERIRRGEARVVLGPRSAIFAPVSELGLLVVDEEQDTAYKQEKVPRYNARDLAIYRGRAQEATVVLVSATPSLESRLNVEKAKMERLELVERVGHGALPEGALIDLKEVGPAGKPGEVHLSPRLSEELEQVLKAGDQAILLRNRRGYSPILLCRACGEKMCCDDCGLPRTYHKRFTELLCHYCGSRLSLPERCPRCGEPALEPIGAGTERVEEKLRELFADVAIDTLDRDSLRRRGSVAAVLERFGRGETQILVGTQMVSKGHHFPRVALAAVIQADTYLGFPDFRAVERTYTLLTQLAGRAGRGDRPGRVLIQTYYPEHYAIQAALRHDDRRFAEEEMRFRRIFHYPPYTRMIQLLVRDSNRERARRTSEQLSRRLSAHHLAAGIRILGPAPAPFEKLRGRWRFQILLRGSSGARLRRLVRAATAKTLPGDLVVDVDPMELL
jgi:primosomal protein N' (replication factor Y)